MTEDVREDPPKRIPLSQRTPKSTLGEPELEDSVGGITAIPHTGTIPKIKPEAAADEHTISANVIEQPLEEDTVEDYTATPTLRYSKWVPRRYGSLAVMQVPFWTGVVMSHFQPLHLLLFVLWLIGYLCFYATGRWLRSGRSITYWRPTETYIAITVILAVVLLGVEPTYLEWAILFMPLILIAALESIRKRKRTLLVRTTTVIAAGMTLMVSYDTGLGFVRAPILFPWLQHTPTAPNEILATSPNGQVSGYLWAFIVTIWVTAYFWTQITFVRAIVARERIRFYRTATVIVHAAATCFAFLFAIFSLVGWFHVAFWVLATLRSWLVPLAIDRLENPAIRPFYTYVMEALAIALLLLTLLFI
ncbi:MAG: YwiC-like family protein [Varibaculum sp.]|nr:YwiC-like family protein [Varibaculum sp.]